MAKVLVLYHSVFGHIERMAGAEAEGAREVAGTEVAIRRVPESLSDDALRKMGGKADQAAQIAKPEASTWARSTRAHTACSA